MSETNEHNKDSRPPKRSERRILAQNIPYDTDWQQLRDWFKETIGTNDAFINLFLHPKTGKQTGSGYIEFRSVDEVQLAESKSGTEFNGRKISLNFDKDDRRLNTWCERQRCSVVFDERYRPVFSCLEDGVPQGGRIGPPSTAPQGHHQPRREPPPPGYNHQGKPIINDVEDLLASSVFFANFPWNAKSQDIESLFKSAGPIVNLELQYEDSKLDDHKKAGKFKGSGITTYTRARDAHRAIIMFNNSMMDGRNLYVKSTKQYRDLPDRLMDLGRPIAEQECINICNNEGIDPYEKMDIFLSNLSYDTDSENVTEVVNLVSECYDTKLLMDKNDPGKSRGVCVARLTSGIDAIQARTVLHESTFKERKVVVRLDKNLARKRGDPVKELPRHESEDNRHSVRNGGRQVPRQEPYYPPPPTTPYSYCNLEATVTSSRYDNKPAFKPEQSHTAVNDEARINELAGLLGFDPATLKALKVMQKSKNIQSQAEPYQANSNASHNSYQRRERSRSPVKNRYGGQRGDGNDHSDYNPSGNDINQKKPGESWQPVTNDTIYIRNLPNSMSEPKLRNLVGACGQISFIDFPLQQDGIPVGYTYIRFNGYDCLGSAKRTIQKYDGYVLDGHRLECGLY